MGMKEYIIQVDEDKKDIYGGMPLLDKPHELVRCKDCKHYHKGFGCDLMQRPCIGKSLDWFCADGERSES